MVIVACAASTGCLSSLSAVLEGLVGPFQLVTPANPRGKMFSTDIALLTHLGAVPTYAYHATFLQKLALIADEGLVPSAGSDWARFADDPDLDEWCLGKVFFAPLPAQALSYVRDKIDAGEPGTPLVVRVPVAKLDTKPDCMGRGGDWFVESTVAAADIEMLTHGKWLQLTSLAFADDAAYPPKLGM